MVFQRQVSGESGFLKDKTAFEHLHSTKAKQIYYLADVFNYLNSVSISMQGEGVSLIDTRTNIRVMLQRLRLRKEELEANNFESFPQLSSVAENIESNNFLLFLQHLTFLDKELSRR